MPPMTFPILPLFITAVKDIWKIEKLLNILFSEVYCWHFGFRRLLFSATKTDMSLYEVLNLFTRWPLVFRSFLHPPLVARDVVTPALRYEFSKWRTGQRGVSMKTTCIFKMVFQGIHSGRPLCHGCKTFHQICVSIVQIYPSLKSAKGTYMIDNVWHTASSSLCSLLQSFFHLVILTY